jgi:hypothetical protein
MSGRIATCLALAKRDTSGAWQRDCYWYGHAFRFADSVAESLNIQAFTAVGFIAALSPRNSWEGQKKHTKVQLQAALQGLPIPHEGTGDMKRKASAIAAGADPLDILRGPKTRAFYIAIMLGCADNSHWANLMSRDEDVVVDVHAWAVATGKLNTAPNVTGYRAASRAYHAVADAAGMNVHAVQAVTWAHWRRTKTLEEPSDG